MIRARPLAASVFSALLAGCGGQESAPEPAASWLAEPLTAVQTSAITAGAGQTPVEIKNPYTDDPGALSQGRQLYNGFNCAGCHGSAGGGGMGPPLADQDWIYGGSDAQIYATIVQGRPNGMPAFGHALTGEAVWKLAAYVKSLGPGTGENQGGGGQGGGEQGRETQGGGQQSGGTQSD
ncbi:MAG TPA: c-type cytochrome [Gemmatimonadales bacterium]|nr:c-type cytochrome [Gemmatimonadales bacterium]